METQVQVELRWPSGDILIRGKITNKQKNNKNNNTNNTQV